MPLLNQHAVLVQATEPRRMTIVLSSKPRYTSSVNQFPRPTKHEVLRFHHRSCLARYTGSSLVVTTAKRSAHGSAWISFTPPLPAYRRFSSTRPEKRIRCAATRIIHRHHSPCPYASLSTRDVGDIRAFSSWPLPRRLSGSCHHTDDGFSAHQFQRR